MKGIIPILATPFHDDETLDLDSLARTIDFMLGIGVDGITVLGVLGESNRLCDEERSAVVDRAVKAAGKRITVIVGASHSGTNVVQRNSRIAQDLGANAVMITPTKEAIPDEERIIESFRRISQGLSIPIVLQDHPASSEVHMSVPLMLHMLKAVPAIRCIKEEAVPTAPKLRKLRDGFQEVSVPILTGLGALYAPFDLEAGSDGFNTGFAFPEVLMAMLQAARRSDWKRVHEIYAWFAPLIVFEQQPGVAIRKELLRRRGLLQSARARHPGATVASAAAKQLEGILDRTLPGVDITRPIGVDQIAVFGNAVAV
ncbi:MAG TPA: dihydrodipicolinate synthase family protein [Bryobacteraceae bacterium]|nr:dihydrodipicolinate synthase family protein [Bryobacteraceae bacterium]